MRHSILILLVFLSLTAQAKIVVDSIPEGKDGGHITYKVFVHKNKNKLDLEPVIRDLGINLAELPDVIPAEKLFSPYIQKWIYKAPTISGPNCWHSSISALFSEWVQERRMSAKEFKCHLENSFKRIASPIQWGDLIRIMNKGKEVHGFTYLGVDSKDPKRILTLTKNGYSISRFVFMDLDDVKDMWGVELRFYRVTRNAEDPSNNSNAVCSGFDDWDRNYLAH